MKALIFLVLMSGCTTVSNPYLARLTPETAHSEMQKRLAAVELKYSHPRSQQEQINDLILQSQRNQMDLDAISIEYH